MIQQAEVNVIIVSFNAEKYIEQAIESVVNQKTNFLFTINVYDDCSTDNTIDIITNYTKEYSHLYLQTSKLNIGTFANLQKAVNECNAQFVALLEGDDYWEDENKLQEQVDFLKANRKYSGCAANSLVYNQSNASFADLYNNHLKTEYTLAELFSIPPFQIGTLIYRHAFLPTIPDEFKNTISNDKVVYTLLAKHGTILCINKPMAVYRKHDISISNSEKADIIYAKHQLLYSIMKKQFASNYHKFIDEALYDHLKGYMITLITHKVPLKFLFLNFFYQWLMLKKWLTLNEYKELYYFSRKIF